jgi:hypothetical protein
MNRIKYTELNCAQLLSECGADAEKWAAAFMQFMAKKNGDFTEHDVFGWFANAMQAALTVKLSSAINDPPHMTGSEAVYGFAAWLTTREEVTTMSASHECSVIADLCDKFCKCNRLRSPRDRWTDYFSMPTKPLLTCTK